jgi:hypothetical protein
VHGPITATMLRPRVKSEHAPYRIAGGKIRIGWVSYGIASEIADPDGGVWTMLTAMDGSRGVSDIIEHVHAEHPERSVNVLRRGAGQLPASGNADADPGSNSSSD